MKGTVADVTHVMDLVRVLRRANQVLGCDDCGVKPARLVNGRRLCDECELNAEIVGNQ
jgi:hypothetical protein